MTLRELKERVDSRVSRLKDGEDEDVTILNNKPSMGPRGMTAVKSVNSGFDWEKGRFIITPENPMIEK